MFPKLVSISDILKRLLTLFLPALFTVSCSSNQFASSQPRHVTTSPLSESSPPSDAIVLFDGAGLSQWQKPNGSAAGWKVTDDFVEVRLLAGSIQTRDAFGDVQLHLEWATPASTRWRGQHRGNSGVKFMGLYEVQILDSYENTTYPDGQAGAVYGQHPPLVNASRPPGEWQSYDIVFLRPRFAEDGSLLRPAYLTVFHNGVLVQDHAAVKGPTSGNAPYSPHADRLALLLQNHRSKVRFRNIWIRNLEAVD